MPNLPLQLCTVASLIVLFCLAFAGATVHGTDAVSATAFSALAAIFFLTLTPLFLFLHGCRGGPSLYGIGTVLSFSVFLLLPLAAGTSGSSGPGIMLAALVAVSCASICAMLSGTKTELGWGNLLLLWFFYAAVLGSFAFMPSYGVAPPLLAFIGTVMIPRRVRDNVRNRRMFAGTTNASYLERRQTLGQ